MASTRKNTDQSSIVASCIAQSFLDESRTTEKINFTYHHQATIKQMNLLLASVIEAP